MKANRISAKKAREMFFGKTIVTKSGSIGNVTKIEAHLTAGFFAVAQRTDGSTFAAFPDQIDGVIIERRDVIGYTIDIEEIKRS